ncbi:cardioacceleratory peptide receptor-like [Ylistrum balloti]|uniref:cardioacceleratory peptide receptor-like n=1 Tax=Ylistrum balloti TaxID=509963 RepID=UPI002905DDA8|nr:cardioacceleratory peptide receptor-like [Ylistrum balloti]
MNITDNGGDIGQPDVLPTDIGHLPPTNNSVPTFYFHQTAQVAFMCVLFLVTMITNTLVLFLIFLSRKIKSRMNMFIANLACADLLVGIFFILTDILWKITIEWHAGNIVCKLIKFTQTFVIYGSSYALVALTIDRLEAIAKPLNLQTRNRHHRVLISLGWFFSFLFSLPLLHLYNEEVVDGGVDGPKVQCWMFLPEPWMWKVYITLIAMAIFVVPALIIMFSYLFIICIIWRKNSSALSSHEYSCERYLLTTTTSANGTTYGTPSLVLHRTPIRGNRADIGMSSRGIIPRARIKTIKITFVIVLAFVLCWSPFFVYDLLDAYGNIKNGTPQSIAVSTFIQSLAPLNSAANPIIYIIFNTQMFAKYCCKSYGTQSPSRTSISHV